MKRSLLGTGILTVALLSGSAFADHGRGHERDHDGWRNHEHAREHVRNVADDHDRRPGGWDHGQKRGWGDNHMPPGQAKKQEMRERHESREQREHEWRDHQRAERAHDWRERREREHEWRERHEAREQHMNDWRERERKERERRAEWRRHHPNAGTWAHNPTSPSSTGTTTGTTGTVTTKNRPSSIILPSGRRIPTRSSTNQ